MGASFLCSERIDLLLQKATTELTNLHGRRERAFQWILRETKHLEEAGFSIEGPPLLAKSIRIVDGSFSITLQLHTVLEFSHKAASVNTETKSL